jgi:hypothetical protein
MEVKTKVCTKCHLEKSLENDFSKHPYALDGRASWCKSCFGEWHKKYEYKRRRNPETRAAILEKDRKYNKSRTSLSLRRSSIKRKYGISLEEWERIFELQGRKCACCGSSEPRSEKGWHMDHNHETGNNRGILCHPCNVVLGLVKESSEHLEKLIAYLRANKSFSMGEKPGTISPMLVMKVAA